MRYNEKRWDKKRKEENRREKMRKDEIQWEKMRKYEKPLMQVSISDLSISSSSILAWHTLGAPGNDTIITLMLSLLSCDKR